MNKKQTYITDEEREKCQKVVDAFAELFENEDLTVVNAGKYGFIKLQYYRTHLGFDNAFSFNDSRSLFNDLWTEWLDTQLLGIEIDTPMEEMDYGDKLKYLPQEKQQELLDMRKRLAEKAGVMDLLDKNAQTKHRKADKRGEDKMSVLQQLYMGNLYPQQEHRHYCPPPGLRDRGTQREHRPCGFRVLQTGHHRHRRRQDDESAGSGKRSRGNSRPCHIE